MIGGLTKAVLSVALLSSLASLALLAWLTYITSIRNLGDATTLEAWKKTFSEEIELRLRAEQALAEKSRSALKAELKEGIADAKDTAKRALAKPQSSVLVPGKTPLPVQVVTPSSAFPLATPTADTNPKHGGVLDSIFGK